MSGEAESGLAGRAARRVQVLPIAIGAYADPRFEPLNTDPEVRKVADLLADFGGYEIPWHVAMQERGADAIAERLRLWSTPVEDHDTILYWVGHGWSNTVDTALAHHWSPYDVSVDGLIPRQLARRISEREGHPTNRDAWAIVIVDTCTSARFVERLIGDLYADPYGARRVLLVGVSGDGSTRLGVFSAALTRSLRNTFRSNTHIRLWDLAGELGRSLPGSTVGVVTPSNLAHAVLVRRLPVAAGVAISLDVLTEIESVLATLTEDERLHFVPMAQGGEAGEVMSYFSGRQRELAQIAGWLRTERTGMLVVTGNAGTGKSAILGHLLVHARPRLRKILVARGLIAPLPAAAQPADDVFDLALLLTGATVSGVVHRIAAAAGLGQPPPEAAPRQAAWLLDRLRSHRRPLTLLLDALDEAQDPPALTDQLIRRLGMIDRVRVVVGTRRSSREDPDSTRPAGRDLLDMLESRSSMSRIVTVEHDSKAVAGYVRQRLRAACARLGVAAASDQIDQVAGAVAEGGREFLFARLAIHEIIARPSLLGPVQAVELASLLSGNHRRLFATAVTRLRNRAAVNGALLQALALAQGRGLPILDGVWGTVASALTGAVPGEEEIDALLRDAAPYLMLDTEDGQTVYRLAHRTFRQSFPALDGGRAAGRHLHRAIVRALLETAPGTRRGLLNSYLVRHLSGHVAAAGTDAWHDLAAEPDLLDQLDPATVTADALRTAFGQVDLPAEVAAVISARHLLINAAPEDRRGLRELALARHAGTYRSTGPAARGGTWSLRWAAVEPLPLHLTLTGHRGGVMTLAGLVSADGRSLLASGGRDGTVRLWDLATGVQIRERPGLQELGWVRAVSRVTTDEGETVLASGGRDGRLRLWNPTTGLPIGVPLARRTGPIYALAEIGHDHAAGDTWLASGGRDGTVRLWDPTGTPVRELPGHTGPVWAVAGFAGRSGQLLISGGDDGTVRLWDPDSRVPILVLSGHAGPVWAVAGIAIPGRRDLVASAGEDGTIRVWDLATGEPVGRPLAGHSQSVRTVAGYVAPDRRTLLVSGGDDGTIRFWDPVASASEGVLTGHESGVQVVAPIRTSDGRTLLASGGRDGTVRVWDPVTATLAQRQRSAYPGSVYAAAADVTAGDGRRLIATGGDDHLVRLWTSAGEPVAEPMAGHDGWVRAVTGVAIAAGEGRLASGSEDGTLRLWDPITGVQVGDPLVGHGGWVLAVTTLVTGDGRRLLVSGGDDGTLRLWDPITGVQVGDPLVGHGGWVLAVTTLVTGDGRRLLVSSGDDGTLRLWDPATGALVRVLSGHAGPVWAVADFAIPDGRSFLASGGADGTVRVWDPDTGAQAVHLVTGHAAGVKALIAVPGAGAGVRLVSGGDDGMVRVWRLATRSQTHVINVRSPVHVLAHANDVITAGIGGGVLALALHPME